MTPQIIFIHIEKTAGTSLVRSTIEPNLDHVRSVGPVTEYWPARRADCVHGHFPYGYHRLSPRRVAYTTMLRDPLDRAVSYYYFIRDLVRTDIWEQHPLRDYADSVTVAEFFENPEHSNMQARYLAGIGFHRLYPYLHRSVRFRAALLDRAHQHLDEMAVFGLREQFERSRVRFAEEFGWSELPPAPKAKRTKDRPSVQKIKEMRPVIIERLQAAHGLDLALYQHARERFG